MGHLTEQENKYSTDKGKHHSLIFECDGADGDYLRISWDEEDPDWRMLWVEVDAPNGFFAKVKYCASVFFGYKKHRLTPGVILGKEEVESIREFFKETTIVE